MTKPLTAVLALQLWEEGAFELNDPVHRYIPAFKHQKVWRTGSTTSPIFDPIIAKMRIWHLFSHTAGLTYGFMNAHPVDEMYRKAGFEWGVPRDPRSRGHRRHVGGAAVAVPAGDRMELLRRPRRPRAGAGGDHRPAARRVDAHPTAGTTRHDRDRLVRRRGRRVRDSPRCTAPIPTPARPSAWMPWATTPSASRRRISGAVAW